MKRKDGKSKATNAARKPSIICKNRNNRRGESWPKGRTPSANERAHAERKRTTRYLHKYGPMVSK